MNLSMKQEQTPNRENRFVVTKGEVGLERDGIGISRCKLLYREWKNDKVLLYSRENYIQYPLINHNGKEYEKEYTYICLTESLCCTTVIKTQCNSIILQLKNVRVINFYFRSHISTQDRNVNTQRMKAKMTL